MGTPGPSRRRPPSSPPPLPARRQRLHQSPIRPTVQEQVLGEQAAMILKEEHCSSLVSFLIRVDVDKKENAGLTPNIELYEHLVHSQLNSFTFALAGLILSPRSYSVRNTALRNLSLLIPRMSGLPSVQQNNIRGRILSCLENERLPRFLPRLIALVNQFVSEDANTGSPGNRWPELFLCLFQSSNPELFEFLGELIETYGSQIRTEVVNCDSLCDRFGALLDPNTSSLELKFAAVVASANFLASWNIPSDQEKYRVLAGKLIQVTGTLDDASRALHALDKLVKLALYKPGIFGTQLAVVYENIFKQVDNAALSKQTTCYSMEVAMHLAERGGQGPEILRSSSIILIQKLIQAILAMLEEDVNNDLNCRGRLLLPRLANVMGGDRLISNFPVDLFNSENWPARRAAVTFIAILGGPTADELEKYFDVIAPTIARLAVDDTQFEVRLEALHAIEELSRKLSPEFQEKCYQQVLPALVSAAHDSDQFIKAQAGWAMLCFSENCTPGVLAPYMDNIMAILMEHLRTGGPALKGKALETLLFLADSAKDHIQYHYSDVMPHLIHLMTHASDEKNKALLAASLNCITMVWVMVGKEKIRDDIDVVVRQLKSWQDSEFSLLDPLRTALVEAWGRICRCLGQEFQPHMPSAIPFLLAIVGRTTSNGVDQSIQQVISEEEKVIACNILCWCAADLKEHFHPWISEVAATLAPLVHVEAHLGTLTAALWCMLSTLRSYEAAVKGTLIEWNTEGFGSLDRIVDSLLNIFEHENSEIKTVAAKAIGVCAQFGGSVFESRVRDAVSRLITVMENFKESHEKGLLIVHDNAVSALGKVLLFHGDKIEASEVINTWLNHLPIRIDQVEAEIAHHCLYSIVEQIHAEFRDPTDAKLRQIIAVYAEILWASGSTATDITKQLIIEHAKRFEERFRGDGWKSIMSTLEIHLEACLGRLLSQL